MAELEERVKTLERCMYGEQLNGNRTEGVYGKVDKMYEQFTFMFRIYKVVMYFSAVAIVGIITILVKLFMGGG
jgi:hypothetical protein